MQTEPAARPPYTTLWLDEVVCSEVASLPPTAFKVWILLKMQVGPQGWCVGQSDIAIDLGVHKSSVQRAIGLLQSAGLLEVIPRAIFGHGQVWNEYRMLRPASLGKRTLTLVPDPPVKTGGGVPPVVEGEYLQNERTSSASVASEKLVVAPPTPQDSPEPEAGPTPDQVREASMRSLVAALPPHRLEHLRSEFANGAGWIDEGTVQALFTWAAKSELGTWNGSKRARSYVGPLRRILAAIPVDGETPIPF